MLPGLRWLGRVVHTAVSTLITRQREYLFRGCIQAGKFAWWLMIRVGEAPINHSASNKLNSGLKYAVKHGVDVGGS